MLWNLSGKDFEYFSTHYNFQVLSEREFAVKQTQKMITEQAVIRL